MNRKETGDTKKGFPCNFRYTGHPQPDATRIFDEFAAWLLANHQIVFSVYETGTLDLRRLQTFEDFKAEQDTGLAPSIKSEFEQWLTGVGPALTPLKPKTSTMATPGATPSSTTDDKERESVMVAQFNLKTKEDKEHNKKVVESSVSVIGTIQMYCDAAMIIKLKQSNVWSAKDLSLVWPVVVKLLTTEDAPTTTKSTALLLDSLSDRG